MPPSPPARATSPRRRPLPSVSIVIPVRDAAGLPLTLRALPPADEVIIVTDGPGDAAAVRAACPGALLVRPTRPGIGNALACGFAASTGDVVVALDGAGCTDPGEIPRYLSALLGGADVALGSRYRDGGRDLTGGRFRRCANLLLIWVVNVLFGVRRTDPGFGYAAFWREAIDRLDLPDPSVRAPAAWGDGPEFAALLAVRTAARGLAVAEIGSVAYPRLRPAARADRTTLRHWLHAIATEFPTRTRRLPTARHAADASPIGRSGLPVPRPSPPIAPPAETRARPWPSSRSAQQPPVEPAATDPGQPAIEPIWGPPQRRPAPPSDLWRADKSSPLDRSAGHRTPQGHRDAKPPRRDPAHRDNMQEPYRRGPAHRGSGSGRRDSEPGLWEAAKVWPAGLSGRESAVPNPREPDPGRAAAAGKRDEQRRVDPWRDEPGREVGAKRRRLDAYRQRPDLRVINGEGTSPGRTPSGRLRVVPRKNLGG